MTCLPVKGDGKSTHFVIFKFPLAHKPAAVGNDAIGLRSQIRRGKRPLVAYVGDESDLVKVVAELRVVEGDHLREDGQILCNTSKGGLA